jgi:hypothetical protein
MAESDVSVSDYDFESRLSESLGTETLQARSMVPGRFRAPPETDSRDNLIWVDGKQFLKVNHAANIRMNSPVSEIWQHGAERRLAGNLSEKFWRCNHCNKASERNRLSDDIIEAVECLKACWDSGIIRQQ